MKISYARLTLLTAAVLCLLGAHPVHAKLPAHVTAMIDDSIKPCDDFYYHACGGWEKQMQVSESTPELRGLTASFTNLRETIAQVLQDTSNPAGKLFASCMNTQHIEELGVAPLQGVLDRVDKTSKHDDLFHLIGKLWMEGVNAFHAMEVGPDPKDAKKNVLQLMQAPPTIAAEVIQGLDPELEADFNNSWASYITTILQTTGVWENEEAATIAHGVVALDKQLISLCEDEKLVSLPQTIDAHYEALTLSEAKEKYPLLSGAFFGGIKNVGERIVVRTPAFFKGAEKLLKESDVETLKAYVNFRIVHDGIIGMPEALRQAHFDFIGILSGQTERPTREAECMEAVPALFPNLMGKLVYEAWQDDEGIELSKTMLKLMLKRMEERIPEVDWLSESTKKEALKKVQATATVIGYSDEVESYTVDEHKSLNYNVEHIARRSNKASLAKLGNPADRKAWPATAAVVNAYHNFGANEVVIPIGFLQTPQFNSSFHPVQNFGGLGVVVGHEITHGFDSKGKYYDEVGSIRSWWSDTDNAEFDKRAQCFIDQYSALPVRDDTGTIVANITGNTTLAENIADNGGLKLAYAGYKLYAKDYPEKLQGFDMTDEEVDELFFLSTAQVFCHKMTAMAVEKNIADDDHSVGSARVNGMMQNNPDFAKVFKCPAGSAMNPSTNSFHNFPTTTTVTRTHLCHPSAMKISYARSTLATAAALCLFSSRPAQAKLPSHVTAMMDDSVKPCDDFYYHACGGWEKLMQLSNRTQELHGLTASSINLQATIGQALQDKSNAAGKLYASCMNTQLIEELGIARLHGALDVVDKAKTREDLFHAIGKLSLDGVYVFHAIDVESDPKDATKYVLQSVQAPPTVPVDILRGMSFKKKEHLDDLWAAYVTTILQETSVWGKEEVVTIANAVVALDKQLISMYEDEETIASPETIDSHYQAVSLSEASKKYPLLLGAFFGGFKNVGDRIIVRVPDFFQKAETILNATDLATLKAYVNFRIVHDGIIGMPEALRQAHFDFIGILSGQTERPTREAECMEAVPALFPNLMGKLVYEAWQDDEGIELSKTMLKLMLKRMEERIPEVDWLSESTRKKAVQKVQATATAVGYSDEMETYTVDENAAYNYNVEYISRQSMKASLAKLGKPVDRKAWSTTAAVVNAFNYPSANQIVIPVGFLQTPQFNASFHPAQNFGGLGVVVGHEITHSFDSNGKYYDEVGSIRNWWSDTDNTEFDKRAQCFIDQYSALPVRDDTGTIVANITGNTTLAENIADNGGLKLAYAGYKLYAKDYPEKLQGFDMTDEEVDELFFLSTAQVFCHKMTAMAVEKNIADDDHSVGSARVNGMMQNNPDFAKVFKCPAGSAMNPSTKCHMWG
ncbi:TPA: hypothetical protein N0F65_004831 [Lagenidium giganteum]|uniref:Endothelin-converting enzyme 1 n=1 Tax=Lagenidium giganteum TaxID=4803 RepID=A0AAV2Z788_9STRA|nr:TPA: hypothetical protein N0F65_004831 [Lagenidium giganteum]